MTLIILWRVTFRLMINRGILILITVIQWVIEGNIIQYMVFLYHCREASEPLAFS
jgi:hypothetical protein